MSYEPFGYGDHWWDRLAPHRLRYPYSLRTWLLWQAVVVGAIIVVIVIS
jgi:hypothetical protein